MDNKITQYEGEIRKILGISPGQDEIKWNWEVNSLKDAKVHITSIVQIQKELRLVKKEIENDIKMIRADFRERTLNVQAGFWSTLSGKKAAGQDRAKKKGDLKQTEISAIVPYENLIRTIDKTLVQLDNFKIELKRKGMEVT